MPLYDTSKINKLLADDPINDNINAFNQMLSSAYAMFSNALDEVEHITPEEERYLLEEKVSQIDNLYQSIVTTYRPHLSRYVRGE